MKAILMTSIKKKVVPNIPRVMIMERINLNVLRCMRIVYVQAVDIVKTVQRCHKVVSRSILVVLVHCVATMHACHMMQNTVLRVITDAMLIKHAKNRAMVGNASLLPTPLDDGMM